MNNYKNVPSEIYDLIEAFEFNQLNNRQQKKVLEHTSETEFNRLHHSNKYAHNSFDLDNQLSPSSSVFENLQSEFKKKHNPHIFVIEKNWNGFLKIAAAILLLVSAAAFTKMYFPNTHIQTVYITKHDTIVESKILSEKSFADTIIIYKDRIINTLNSAEKLGIKTSSPIADSSITPNVNMQDYGLIQIKRLRENSIKNSGRSIAEDTLIRDIGFVRL